MNHAYPAGTSPTPVVRWGPKSLDNCRFRQLATPERGSISELMRRRGATNVAVAMDLPAQMWPARKYGGIEYGGLPVAGLDDRYCAVTQRDTPILECR